jgi:7-cyano-7-deazaguanine synthase
MRSTILLSGGLDSVACLSFALERGESLQALHVQYGQAAAGDELRAAKAVCSHYNVSLWVVELGKPYASTEGYMAGRNLLLLSAALTQNIEPGLLYFGFHLDTSYPDCGAAFIDASQRIVDIYHAGAVQLFAPFLDSRKAALAAFCARTSVPVHLTYSCETGGKPCGQCLSCRDREAVGM